MIDFSLVIIWAWIALVGHLQIDVISYMGEKTARMFVVSLPSLTFSSSSHRRNQHKTKRKKGMI